MNTLSYVSDGVSGWGWLVTEGMFKGTILLLVAVVVHFLLTKRFELLRSAIWNACLVGLIAIPVAMLCLPRVTLGLPASKVVANPIVPNLSLPADLSGANPEDSSNAVGEHSITKTIKDRSTPTTQGAFIMSIPTWLGAAYAIGALFFSMRFVGSLLAVRQLADSATGVANPEWQFRVHQLAQQLGIQRGVSLCKSEDVTVPMVVGLTRPMILLPQASVAELSPTELEAILLHELAHVRRSDYLWLLMQRLVQVVHWPNPLVWFSGKLIGSVRESSCDAYCIHAMQSRERYSQSLAALAAVASTQRSSAVALAAVRPARIQRRLQAIDGTLPSRHCVTSRGLRLACLSIVSALAIGFGALEAKEKEKLVAESSEAEAEHDHKHWNGMHMFEGGRDFGVADMQRVAERSDIQVLMLPNTRVTDSGLTNVTTLNNLEHLILNFTAVTDAGLANVGKLTELKGLALSRTKVTGAGMKHLKDLRELDALYLYGTAISDDGLKQLEPLTNLTVLNLNRTRITDEGLKSLQQMKKLEYLFLSFTDVSDVGVGHLVNLNDLIGISLVRTEVSSKGLECFRRWPKLEILSLAYTNVTDLGLEHLKGLAELKELDLSGTHITDSGLLHLRDLWSLESLRLAFTTVGDEGLKHLTGLKNLQNLDLTQTPVNEVAIGELKQKLPNLKVHGPWDS